MRTCVSSSEREGCSVFTDIALLTKRWLDWKDQMALRHEIYILSPNVRKRKDIGNILTNQFVIIYHHSIPQFQSFTKDSLKLICVFPNNFNLCRSPHTHTHTQTRIKHLFIIKVTIVSSIFPICFKNSDIGATAWYESQSEYNSLYARVAKLGSFRL